MMDDETRRLLNTARDWALQAQVEQGWSETRSDFIKRIETALDADGVAEVRDALIEAVRESGETITFGDVRTSKGTVTFRQALELLAPFAAKRLQPRMA